MTRDDRFISIGDQQTLSLEGKRRRNLTPRDLADTSVRFYIEEHFESPQNLLTNDV